MLLSSLRLLHWIPKQARAECSSCGERAVRAENNPYYMHDFPMAEITGYKRRENPMPFEGFVYLEIDRRIRTDEWHKLEERGITQ